MTLCIGDRPLTLSQCLWAWSVGMANRVAAEWEAAMWLGRRQRREDLDVDLSPQQWSDGANMPWWLRRPLTCNKELLLISVQPASSLMSQSPERRDSAAQYRGKPRSLGLMRSEIYVFRDVPESLFCERYSKTAWSCERAVEAALNSFRTVSMQRSDSWPEKALLFDTTKLNVSPRGIP